MNRRHSAALERAVLSDPTAFRILTGDRPTGPLHIGHSSARSQPGPPTGLASNCFFWSPTTMPSRAIAPFVSRSSSRLVADYLAFGIDPERSTHLRPSPIPELNELLSCSSPVSVAGSDATRPSKTRSPPQRRRNSALLTYPVHQAADILFCRPTCPRWQGPTPAPRAHPHDRPPLQQPYPLPSSPTPGTADRAPLLLGLDGRR